MNGLNVWPLPKAAERKRRKRKGYYPMTIGESFADLASGSTMYTFVPLADASVTSATRTIKFYAETAGEFKVGIFERAGGLNLKCIAVNYLGACSIGANTHIIQFPVKPKNLIGIYADAGGEVSMQGSGGRGALYTGTDALILNETSSFNAEATWLISIYGERL